MILQDWKTIISTDGTSLIIFRLDQLVIPVPPATEADWA
jgi:hypothetical protein